VKKIIIPGFVLLIFGIIAGVYYLLAYTPVFQTPIFKVSSCNLPCWNQIHIGKTTLPEFIKIINELAFVDKESITQRKFSKDLPYIAGFFAHPSRINITDIQGAAVFKDNVIVYFSLTGHLNTKMQEMVEKFGEPDLVLTTGPRPEIYVTFVNLQKGVAYGRGVENENVTLSKDLSLQYIYLFDPKMFELLSKARLFLTADYTYPWSGYGILKEKYLPKEK
jgi:hypothetical protein